MSSEMRSKQVAKKTHQGATDFAKALHTPMAMNHSQQIVQQLAKSFSLNQIPEAPDRLSPRLA